MTFRCGGLKNRLLLFWGYVLNFMVHRTGSLSGDINSVHLNASVATLFWRIPFRNTFMQAQGCYCMTSTQAFHEDSIKIWFNNLSGLWQKQKTKHMMSEKKKSSQGVLNPIVVYIVYIINVKCTQVFSFTTCNFFKNNLLGITLDGAFLLYCVNSLIILSSNSIFSYFVLILWTGIGLSTFIIICLDFTVLAYIKYFIKGKITIAHKMLCSVNLQVVFTVVFILGCRRLPVNHVGNLCVAWELFSISRKLSAIQL